jgi:hypothetical protein
VIAQSESLPLVQPVGQQPSPPVQATGVTVHARVHSVPVNTSFVHAFPSLHVVGQAPGIPAAIDVSQVSPVSTRPFPHTAGQLPSLRLLHPIGQQPSPEMHAVIAG